MIEKRFLTIDEQIQTLKNQGLVFGNEKKAKTILKTHSYYSIVNTYCDRLVDRKSPRRFKQGATFEELLAIRDFDTSFRRYLFPQILYIEEKLKAVLINAYCSAKNDQGEYIHRFDDYLCLTSYETFNDTKMRAASKLVEDFQSAIRHISAVQPFKHALDKYGYLPFWIFATQLSFGQIGRFYECNHVNIRRAVASVYGLSESEFKTVLKILNNVRNNCAHNNRVFSMGFPHNLPRTLGSGESLVVVDGCCFHKFGSVLYCLEILLSKNKFQRIIRELNDSLAVLRKALHTVSIQLILKDMGISSAMRKRFGILP